jgi:hypothetical protein
MFRVLVVMLVVVMMVMMPLHVTIVLMIFGFRKITQGARTTATAKSSSLRSSQKINDGK